MTTRQLDKMADTLAERYGLSYQLTASWLRKQGINKPKLSPAQVDDLIRWARV
jgi:hypothetical protein